MANPDSVAQNTAANFGNYAIAGTTASSLAATGNAVVALPILPVRQLAGVFSACNVLVSNDCGPMHIGVAVGTKTLGIFGPEPPEVWFHYPLEDGHLALFKKIECSPCRQTSCHRAGTGYLECMKLISVDEILEEVGKRL